MDAQAFVVEDFTKEGFKTLIEATKNANSLPPDKDWKFYSTDDTFNSLMDEKGSKVLGLINSIMRKYGVVENIKHRDLDAKIELVIDTNDVILERAANHIDEMNGIRKVFNEPVEIQTVTAQLPVNGSWNKISKATFSVNSQVNIENKKGEHIKSIHLLTAKNITRPQKFFKDKIDNSNTYPWEPRITYKPNSIKPLAIYMEETEQGESYCHPYEVELEKFAPTEEQLKLITPTVPKPIADTPLHEINTPEELDNLSKELLKYKEFAVDLEHHSYRTFMGITCLMQISTCDADYLIDTLTLRDKLHTLNESFTNPSIVKIFHGADLDVQWLQRDLSTYVVNMFDTHQAAKQLGYAGLSLSYLLNKFCDFLPNKKFQLADWRIRPLPEQLKRYAREDTHYLIYIYQLLKQELLKISKSKDGILRNVINSSTEICKKRYFKPRLTEESHMNFYRKCKRMFDNRQMYALKHLYAWRDAIAREEDESTGYVLPNHMLLQIAESLPREMQGILACCNPIPPLVRSNLLELHQIVLKAREQSLQKPIMNEENRSRGSTQQLTKINVDNPLFCPHDLTKSQDFRDDLPTLLGGHFKNSPAANSDINIECKTSKVRAFNCIDEDKCKNVTMAKENLKFLGPYERYKLIKPYIQAEEEKSKANKGAENSTSQDQQEDKIALLHEHFVKTPIIDEPKLEISTELEIEKLQTHVNNEISAYNEERKSLAEMGGSKKRKRDSFGGEDAQNSSKNLRIAETDFQTPVPNLNAGNNKFRKRKLDNNDFFVQKQARQDNNANDNRSQETNRGRGRNRNRSRQKTFNNKAMGAGQVQGQPFDYSAVDYKQFQGGASGIRNNNKKNKNKFKPQKNMKKFKGTNFNKSSTFSRNN